MQLSRSSYVRLVFILGLLSMLMPLAIDMYLPAFPTIAAELNVEGNKVQMTLISYIIGFALGQLFYGPMADSVGRKPVIVAGTLIFGVASIACALAQNIDQLIYVRLLHGLSAAAAGVVINALIRDMFSRDEFSRIMSFVTLVMTVAPLLAPILGGWMLKWFSWHAIFWSIAVAAFLAAFLVIFNIKESLPQEKRQKFSLRAVAYNFITLFRHKRALCYILASAFSFSGMFSFLSAGPFVYIQLYGVPAEQFGYYFALNVVFLFIITLINSRFVRKKGAVSMFYLGLALQLIMGIWLLMSQISGLGFISLVIGVAAYVGCISMISSNAMAIILEDFPHMAGTVSSVAGTLRFGVGALVGFLLAQSGADSAWPMITSMVFCVICAVGLVVWAHRMHFQRQ